MVLGAVKSEERPQGAHGFAEGSPTHGGASFCHGVVSRPLSVQTLRVGPLVNAWGSGLHVVAPSLDCGFCSEATETLSQEDLFAVPAQHVLARVQGGILWQKEVGPVEAIVGAPGQPHECEPFSAM
jgi:hypothetical protein